MATTEAGRVLTERHRLQQLGLRAATIRDLIRLYPMWRLNDPGSFDRLVDAIYTLAQLRVRDASALAARYYEMFRDAEIGGLPLTIGKAAAIAEPPTRGQIEASVSVTCKQTVYRALNAGLTQEAAMQQGLVQLSGSVGRHVLNGGRDTIIETVRRDPRAVGWARVTDGDPCYFCAMLASRGPVYKQDTVGFQAHDHCSCATQPVYRDDDWPGRAREYSRLWDASTSGTGGPDAIRAFRKAIEGRD